MPDLPSLKDIHQRAGRPHVDDWHTLDRKAETGNLEPADRLRRGYAGRDSQSFVLL